MVRSRPDTVLAGAPPLTETDDQRAGVERRELDDAPIHDDYTIRQ
jgi:hypothetical protein